MRKRGFRLRWVAGGIALLALAGCGSTARGLSAGDTADPGQVPASVWREARFIGLETLVRGGGGDSVAWSLMSSSPASGFINIVYRTRSCDPVSTDPSVLRVAHQGVQLVQTPSEVQIAVLEGDPPRSGDGCADVEVLQRGTVQLDKFLGEREIVHAPVTLGPAVLGR